MVKGFKTGVLIVGGGPAGLATALALRQRGVAVTVADARKPPIDKACGEGLMPDSLSNLAALGIDLKTEVAGGDRSEFAGIRFVSHGFGTDEGKRDLEMATARFPADGDASGTGVGVRRQTLHAVLAAKAESCGVDLRWESPVQLRSNGQVLVAGAEVRYDWLVGADGLSSRVRAWAGLEGGKVLSRRFGFRRHYRVKPWSPYVEVHWGKSGQAYVTPVGPEEVCIATVGSDAHLRLEAMLGEMPALGRRLRETGLCETQPVGSERGGLTTTRRLDRVTRERVALVGDASGSVDAITGEGMGLAFRQALALAECIAAKNLSRYQERHRQILQLPQTMARVLLLMDRSHELRDRALRLLAAEPELFPRLLGVHLGSEPAGHFIAGWGLPMAWGLVFPRKPFKVGEIRPSGPEFS